MDLKNCPHGCPRTTRSLEVYAGKRVRCTKCDAYGPHLNYCEGYNHLNDAGQKEAAMLLWNARLPAERNTILERIKNRPSSLNEAGKAKVDPTAPSVDWVWRTCLKDYQTLVQGVEYRTLITGADLITVEDDDQISLSVPSHVFLPEWD